MSAVEPIVWWTPDGTSELRPGPEPVLSDARFAPTAATVDLPRRDRDRLVVMLVLAPFALIGTLALSSWLGNASVGADPTPPAEFEAAAQRCLVEVAHTTGAPLLPSSVEMTIGERRLRLDGVTRADAQRLVRCEIAWSPGFQDVVVDVGDAPTPT